MLQVLFSVFGTEQKADELKIEGYLIGLRDLTDEQVEQAVIKAIDTHKRFVPTPAELRDLVQAQGSDSDKIQKTATAFQELDLMCQRFVADGQVTTDNTALAATIQQLGGMRRIVDLGTGDKFHVWLRREFDAIYPSYIGHDVGLAQKSQWKLGEKKVLGINGRSDEHVESVIQRIGMG